MLLAFLIEQEPQGKLKEGPPVKPHHAMTWNFRPHLLKESSDLRSAVRVFNDRSVLIVTGNICSERLANAVPRISMSLVGYSVLHGEKIF